MSPFSIVLFLVIPLLVTAKLQGFDIPLSRNVRRTGKTLNERGELGGSIGLGNNADLLYTVPVEFGNTATAVHLDTGSSDLWVITDGCRGGACDTATSHRYPTSSLKPSGTDVAMYYGDSTTGTNATGAIAFDTVTIAGIAVEDQPFGAIDFTSNPVVRYATAGIMGLGFPSGSKVQEGLVTDKIGPIGDTEAFIESTWAWGPALARIIMSDELVNSMFSISLQRNTIDIGGGTGTLTVGKLPDGIDMNALTWVPVRRYTASEGGLRPPGSLPNEVYAFRWEIDIEGVFLDGQRLPDSTIPANGVDGKRNSALIDTGNSILRGPADVVQNIMTQISGKPDNTMPCSIPRNLAFQIGGKMFPIDPRDLIGQHLPNDATTCVADNLVSTDPPRYGALFRWSLGDPFFRSNLVAFHYGNLEQPSLDPPMIGLLSMVPSNADDLLRQAVQDAVANGGNFESTLQVAPTAQAASEGQTTVIPKSADLDQLKLATSPVNNNPAAPTETDPPSRSQETSTTNRTEKDNAALRLSHSFGYSIVCLLSVFLGMVLL